MRKAIFFTWSQILMAIGFSIILSPIMLSDASKTTKALLFVAWIIAYVLAKDVFDRCYMWKRHSVRIVGVLEDGRVQATECRRGLLFEDVLEVQGYGDLIRENEGSEEMIRDLFEQVLREGKTIVEELDLYKTETRSGDRDKPRPVIMYVHDEDVIELVRRELVSQTPKKRALAAEGSFGL